jgi:lipoate-protein ligase A
VDADWERVVRQRRLQNTLSPKDVVHSAQLILDDVCDGAWNMALDEARLHAAENDGAATLRFYGWREPTLSLGYFQKHADRALHLASQTCTLIRRASGGGAILHDRELTYSIALPKSHSLAVHAEPLYLATHRSLIAALAQFGVQADLCSPAESGRRATSDEPFLCFQRRTFGDVLVGPSKICGSAQRRQRGAVLQHGSILLAQSAFAPELPGIAETAGVQIANAELIEAWLPLLAKALGVNLEPGSVGDGLSGAAEEIGRQKFAADEWTFRR